MTSLIKVVITYIMQSYHLAMAIPVAVVTQENWESGKEYGGSKGYHRQAILNVGGLVGSTSRLAEQVLGRLAEAMAGPARGVGKCSDGRW